MLLDSISKNVFRPFSSINASLYIVGLDALYKRIVLNEGIDDECNPKMARDVIATALLMNGDLAHNWSPEDEAGIIEYQDVSGKIYARLKDTEWIYELNSQGYRKVVGFYQQPLRLLKALYDLAKPSVSDLGVTCHAIARNLKGLKQTPCDNASSLPMTASEARKFRSELVRIRSDIREMVFVAFDKPELKDQLHTFFTSFWKEFFPKEYEPLIKRNNPLFFQSEIISSSVFLIASEDHIQAISEGLHKSADYKTISELRGEIRRDLQDIVDSFHVAKELLDSIAGYHYTLTRRISDSIHYFSMVVPTLDLDIDAALTNLERFEAIIETENDVIPAIPMIAKYLSPERLYQPRKIKNISEPTLLEEDEDVPLEMIALELARDEYQRKRKFNAERLTNYLDYHFASKGTDFITSDDLTIEVVDDLLAFLDLRELIMPPNDGDGEPDPVCVHLPEIHVEIVNNETTITPFVSCAKIAIWRKQC
jgi:hypothetical protein